jgi:hypothetical protein
LPKNVGKRTPVAFWIKERLFMIFGFYNSESLALYRKILRGW